MITGTQSTAGLRLSMTDASRWQRRATAPAVRDVPEPAAESGDPLPDNVDNSLKERIQRFSRRPEPQMEDAATPSPRAARRAEPPRERPEADDQAFTPALTRPAASQPERSEPRPRTDVRQSARRRQDFDDREQVRVPATRRPAEPEPYGYPVQQRTEEIDMLQREMDELRHVVAGLREEIKELRERPERGAKGFSVIERTMQRLSERMDRIDGGAAPPEVTGPGDRTPRRRKGLLNSLFG